MKVNVVGLGYIGLPTSLMVRQLLRKKVWMNYLKKH